MTEKTRNHITGCTSWTKSEENLLRRYYGRKSLTELAAILKRTFCSVKSRVRKLKLTTGNRHQWTAKENKYLRKHYSNTLTEKLATRLGLKAHCVYNHAHAIGLRKDPKFVYKINRILGLKLVNHPAWIANRFKKGVRSGYRPPKGIHLSPATEFKKGHQPANTLYDNAITIRLEKTGHQGKKRMMKFIRTSKGKWIYLKNYIWEKHRGKVPKGKLVAFKNPKDPLNCSIRNLCLMTKEEAMDCTRETDEWIASCLSHPKGAPLGSYDHKLAKKILKHYPKLIKLKRAEMALRRTICQS